MAPLDWVVIAGYFGLLAAVAWWVIRQRQDSSADYFLAGRNIGWFVIGASLFASNIGSEHLVGLAGTGAQDGVAMAHYELHAWCLLVLGWILVPFYAQSMVFTMPEFLEKRYSPAARWFLSVVSLVSYVFTKIAVALFAAGIVFETLFPEPLFAGISNFWVGAIGLVLVTGAYTVAGGLRAVVYTDAIQMCVLIFGSIFVTSLGLYHLGGWSGLRAAVDPEMFNLWKPLTDPGKELSVANILWTDQKFPWLGILFCAPIVGLWYWTTDQYIVQRVLAAPNQTQARRGTIFGAYLKLTPVFLFIIPGIIAYALAQQETIDAGLIVESNRAYPALVRDLLPMGIRGLVVAALLAALMSSLSSVFNSASTLFTMDIYKKIHPEASEHTLVWVGRVATTVIVLCGLVWIPLITLMSDTLYEYLQAVQAYIAPPITAVFFFGVFFRRLNAAGCMAGLVAGFLMGMTRLGSEILSKAVAPGGFAEGNAMLTAWFGNGTFLHALATINFLYFSMILFAISVAIIVGVSLMTAPPSAERIRGLTYATVTAENREETRASWNVWDVLHTAIVLGLILAAYLYFTG